jgi:hypothetical protein
MTMRASDQHFVAANAPILDASVFHCAWCGDETLACECNALPTYEQVRDAIEMEPEHARRKAA